MYGKRILFVNYIVSVIMFILIKYEMSIIYHSNLGGIWLREYIKSYKKCPMKIRCTEKPCM